MQLYKTETIKANTNKTVALFITPCFQSYEYLGKKNWESHFKINKWAQVNQKLGTKGRRNWNNLEAVGKTQKRKGRQLAETWQSPSYPYSVMHLDNFPDEMLMRHFCHCWPYTFLYRCVFHQHSCDTENLNNYQVTNSFNIISLLISSHKKRP